MNLSSFYQAIHQPDVGDTTFLRLWYPVHMEHSAGPRPLLLPLHSGASRHTYIGKNTDIQYNTRLQSARCYCGLKTLFNIVEARFE